jgi:Tol biopolymer transport system component
MRYFTPVLLGGLLLMTIGCAPLVTDSSQPYATVPQTGFGCLTTTTLVNMPADDLDPVWSPDGRSMAYVGHSDGNPEVYLARWDDSSPFATLTNLSNTPEDDYQPHWSPDGRYLAWLHRQDQYTWRPVEIRVTDLDSGQVQIAAPGYETRWFLGWVADSQALVYRQDNAFYVYNVAAQEGRLFHEVGTESPGVFWSLSSTLSPDGRWLLESSRNAEGVTRTNLVQVETGNQRILNMPDGDAISFPAWSPDSRYAALTYNHDSQLTLWLLNAETGDMKLLHEDEAPRYITSMDFSSDGRLAWVLTDNADLLTTIVYLTDPQTGETRPLFNLEHSIERVVWSPVDPDVLAFRTFAGLYVADAKSGLLSELFQGVGKLLDIRWSPAGTALAVQVNNQWAYPYGTALVDLASRDVFFYNQAAIGMWSPDGKRLTVDYIPFDWQGKDILSINFCDWKHD